MSRLFHFPHRLGHVAALGGLAVLSACGGGNDAPPPPAAAAAATRVVGVAATGGPLAGATVSLIDASATTTDPAPQTADAQGRFAFTVDGLQAPFAINVSSTQDGLPRTLIAVLTGAQANADNTANVTPLTHAVAALVAPGGDPAALESPSALQATTPGTVANAVATLVAVLSSDPAVKAKLDAAAGSGGSFDPMLTAFVADGTGVDAVLDQLTVTVNPPGASPGTVRIQNNLQAPGSDGVAPPVAVTPTTTPATAPTLPPTASGELPTPAELEALAADFRACYALPAAQRVTATDADGQAIAIAPACDYAVADYLNNGYDWIRSQGPSLLSANNDGATFQRPTVALVIPPQNVTDPKESKHPYCDQSPCVVFDVRGTLPAAGGQPFRRGGVIAKVGTAWKIIGNHRPFDMDVQLRLGRLVNQNAAPLAPSSYFSTSRYEAVLRLALNPLGPGGIENVRVARVTGPGLPAAGVVLSRSSRCTSDRFAITAKNGDTFVVDGGINQPRYYTNGASNDFKLGAATLDGLDVTNWPGGNVDFADVHGSDPVKAWGVYTWEFFHFGSATPTVPDRVHRLRLSVTDTDVEAYLDAPTKWWASLSAADLADYLQPGGAKAGALPDATLAWTVPEKLVRVDSTYLFSQNTVAVGGVKFNKRTVLSPQIAKPGDTAASIVGGQAQAVSGTSTSPFTSGIVAAQNPRCAETDRGVTPLTGNNGDYREIGLGTTLFNGLRLQSAFFWSP